jgi:acyl-coenzyme A thioesterase PaaI-like protein
MIHLHPACIRRRTLAALAGNRAPGFHFAGYFLQLEWPRIGERDVLQTMAAGPHCLDAGGGVSPAALGVAIDGALASAARLATESGGRLATVNLSLQYTGRAAMGTLAAEARLEGFYTGAGVPHAVTRAVLTTGGEAVCYASGTFVPLPAPPGVELAPLPWQQGALRPPPLEMEELTVPERAVVDDADAALAANDSRHAFIQRFWGLRPKPTSGGASCRVPIGPQIGNRVGHVQGGILFGLAQATASAAVPGHPAVSTISAWYISPGRGKCLNVRSKVVHAGRSFAVVRTEIRNADRSLVLEAMSNHASLGRGSDH